MKNIVKYSLVALLGLSLTSCDAIFDSLEGDLNKMYEKDLVGSAAGIDRLMSYAYQQIPMNAFGTNDKNTLVATDTHGQSYSIVNNGSISYSAIRGVNKIFAQLDAAVESKVLTKENRDIMTGELTFIRAYQYFAAVRAYGGMPIVTEPLDDKLDEKNGNPELYVPRNTEKEVWDFVLTELDKAADLLPVSNKLGEYRITKGAALALKSRVALYAASVSKFWKEAEFGDNYTAVKKQLTYMDAAWADGYYKLAADAAKAVMDLNVYALHGGATTNRATAERNLFELFQSKTSEFIFGKSYESGVSGASNGWDYNNSPNQGHIKTVGWQWARYSVTLNIADAFDNYGPKGEGVDGTIVTRTDGVENDYVTELATTNRSFKASTPYKRYDKLEDPFADKDARFKAWLIYPGQTFRSEYIIMQGGILDAKGIHVYDTNYSSEKNGKKYFCLGADGAEKYSGFDRLTDNNAGNWYSTGFGVKKYLLNQADPLGNSTNPWYDLRYAEVLLNYAEAVAECPSAGDATLAAKALNDIRHRAAFTDDIELTPEAVQHERYVELCFENDHPATLHRRRAAHGDNVRNDRARALVPVLDLTGAQPAYIFVRANSYYDDLNTNPGGHNVTISGYYSGVPNMTKNRFEPNPSQE